MTQFTCSVVNAIINERSAKKNISILSSLYVTEIQQEL